MPVPAAIKNYLRDTFYSSSSTGLITRDPQRGRIEDYPSNRLAKALGVIGSVAMVVIPTAGAVGIYMTMVGSNIEGEMTPDSFAEAHRSLFDTQEAQATVAGARGPHHDDGVDEALMEAEKVTPMEAAAEANARGWRGEGIETLLEEHRIHLVNGVFVPDPSTAHEASEELRMIVDFVRQGSATLSVTESLFTALTNQALAQFALASTSYAAISDDLRGSDLHLDTVIHAVSGENKAEIQFDMVTGQISVHEVGVLRDWFSDAPVISAAAYDESGDLNDPHQVIENAKALDHGPMLDVIETAAIMARLDRANMKSLVEHGFLGGALIEELAQGPAPK
jgi:hypothetical protein